MRACAYVVGSREEGWVNKASSHTVMHPIMTQDLRVVLTAPSGHASCSAEGLRFLLVRSGLFPGTHFSLNHKHTPVSALPSGWNLDLL